MEHTSLYKKNLNAGGPLMQVVFPVNLTFLILRWEGMWCEDRFVCMMCLGFTRHGSANWVPAEPCLQLIFACMLLIYLCWEMSPSNWMLLLTFQSTRALLLASVYLLIFFKKCLWARVKNWFSAGNQIGKRISIFCMPHYCNYTAEYCNESSTLRYHWNTIHVGSSLGGIESPNIVPPA